MAEMVFCKIDPWIPLAAEILTAKAVKQKRYFWDRIKNNYKIYIYLYY
jgi:hypothetical protein